MLTEGGATAESPEGKETGTAEPTSVATETAAIAEEAVAQPTGEAAAATAEEAELSAEKNESAEVLAAS
jgi:hypothetical protein